MMLYGIYAPYEDGILSFLNYIVRFSMLNCLERIYMVPFKD